MNPSTSSTGATAGGGRIPNQQPRPSRASMEGVSPLMYSCQQNNVQQVRQLLQRKVIAITFYFIFLLPKGKTDDRSQSIKLVPILYNNNHDEGGTRTSLHLLFFSNNFIQDLSFILYVAWLRAGSR